MSGGVHLNALGIVCAIGQGKAEVARRLFAGDVSGFVSIDNAVSGGESLLVGAVSSEVPPCPDRLARYASRNFSLALAALAEIDSEVRVAISQLGADRIAVVMGTSTSGISVGEDVLGREEVRAEQRFPSGYDFLQQEIGSTAESIAGYYELAGPAITVSTACSSGAKALAVARRLIGQGLADAVIVGGCDSRCALTLNGFYVLSALSKSTCRPFSVNRDGTVLGEGAAIFLMSRDPTGPYLAGVGESADGYSMTAPHPDGSGAISAMQRALKQAGVSGPELDYVNLHGTGTLLNDAMESRAVRQVVGDAVPCSSSKGQIGHTLGAAGAIEAAICWLTLQHNPEGLLPPHAWDEQPDSAAPLPGMVDADMRLDPAPRHLMMSNSYAFGGSNACVILGNHRDP
jgi:3-oxoacyl-[acyl-carrier-protein] synthase-1